MSVSKPTIVYWKFTGRASAPRFFCYLAFGKDGFENNTDFGDFGELKKELADSNSARDALLADTAAFAAFRASDMGLTADAPSSSSPSSSSSSPASARFASS